MENTSAAGRISQIVALLEEVSGLDIGESDFDTSFLDLGLDSLFLTQVALNLQKRFEIKLSFRQLIENYRTVNELAAHVETVRPSPKASASPAPASPVPPPAAAPAPASPGAARQPPPAVTAPRPQPVFTQPIPAPQVQSLPASDWGIASQPGTLEAIIAQQLRLMEQQVALLAQGGLTYVDSASQTFHPGAVEVPTEPPQAEVQAPEVTATPAQAPEPSAKPEEPPEPKKVFGAMAKISLGSHSDELTPAQRSRLDAFVRRYNAKTAGSKRLTQQNRERLADPRVVTGFRPVLKEIVYPLVVERSKGPRFWDVDGNEYIDVQCGFGSNFFGWSPPFIIDAIKAQLDRGIEIGPQHPMAGEVAALFCELTGADRAALCNTGSEAVMGALRIARTVSGKRLVASFNGDYHGVFDEVLVRGTKKLKSLPAAPGIMNSAVENTLVLDYGDPRSLDVLREHAHELAAVLVEPVQSRQPDLQPREFLHALRKLTEELDIALIFDEVVTGFRIHPGGAQAHFGVKADIATYGKIVGGGLPIGVLAGRKKYMDALDGGSWSFGDDSAPTVGVTYFAGTFVRHPAALAAAKAVLTEMKAKGPSLQEGLTAKISRLATELNAHFEKVGAPLKIKHFGSVWKPMYTQELPFGELLATYLRDAGIHIRDGFPCFLTTSHTDEDVDTLIKAFKSAVEEMQSSGFMPGDSSAAAKVFDANTPPVPGARLGRDASGNPAWFIADPGNPGKYLQVN